MGTFNLIIVIETHFVNYTLARLYLFASPPPPRTPSPNNSWVLCLDDTPPQNYLTSSLFLNGMTLEYSDWDCNYQFYFDAFIALIINQSTSWCVNISYLILSYLNEETFWMWRMFSDATLSCWLSEWIIIFDFNECVCNIMSFPSKNVIEVDKLHNLHLISGSVQRLEVRMRGSQSKMQLLLNFKQFSVL